jgi:hypothetical protein
LDLSFGAFHLPWNSDPKEDGVKPQEAEQGRERMPPPTTNDERYLAQNGEGRYGRFFLGEEDSKQGPQSTAQANMRRKKSSFFPEKCSHVANKKLRPELFEGPCAQAHGAAQ